MTKPVPAPSAPLGVEQDYPVDPWTPPEEVPEIMDPWVSHDADGRQITTMTAETQTAVNKVLSLFAGSRIEVPIG